MLTLRGIDFGSIFCAPGARGFFGEGYPFHGLARLLGMTWEGTGFVSKTIVYPPRKGNMPLGYDRITPVERLIPRSIAVKLISGHVLNAVGLSGPGAEWALGSGRWQGRTDPFMISFMSVAGLPEERLAETKLFAELLTGQLPNFKGEVAVQVNRACPTSGHTPDEYYAENSEVLDTLGAIGVPVVVNYNPTVPGEVMLATAQHSACEALWLGNTIPWGDPRINWEAIFGTTESPLAKRNLPIAGDGGLSGPACLAHTVERVLEARKLGITKPIVAGNGIQRPSDVRLLRRAGADAVAIGVVGIVRPWRMKGIVAVANDCMGNN